MKNFTPSSLLLVVLLFWMNKTFAQISEIEVSINWTSWASDNAVSIYDANDNLLLFVCDPSGCQTTASNSSYSTTINLGCHLDGNGYYLVAEDAYGDGWNGTGNYVRISVAGTQVVDYDLTAGSSSGNVLFNVSGGGSCPSTDISIQSVTGVSSGCNLSSSEQVTVVLKNQGLDTITSAPIWYNLDGTGNTLAGTFTGTLLPGDTSAFNFNINASSPGNYTLDVFTVMAGDVNSTNDSSLNLTFTNSSPHNFNLSGAFNMGFEPNEEIGGWTNINYNQDGGSWNLQNNTNPRTGSNAAMYNYNVSNAANDWFISPCLSLEAGTQYALEFYYRAMSASFPEAFEVHLMASPDSSNSLNIITSYNNITSTTYASSLDTISVLASGNYYIGWKATSAADQYNLFIDDITISKISTIDVGISSYAPIASTCSFSASEQVSINISNYGINSANGYSIWYNVDNGTYTNAGVTPTAINSGDSTSINFNVDLSSPGSHVISVVVELSGDGNTLNDTVSISAVSQSIDFSLTQLNMGFETGEDFTAWSILNANGDARQWQSTTTNTNSGARAFRIRNSNQAADDWLFTPCLALDTGETYVLDFFYRARNAGFSENLEIHITSDVNTSSSAQVIYTDNGFNHTTYQNQVTEFTVSSPGTYHIAFRSNSAANQRGMFIDDITIYNTTNNWLGYSQDWNDAANWANGTPSESSSILIPSTPAGGNFPYLTASRNSGSVLIEANAQINMIDTVKLHVKGNLNAQSNANKGHIVMNGTGPQTVKGNCNFKSLKINNPSGVSLQSGTISIDEELDLTNGTLELNGNDLVLTSNEFGDARILPVTNGSISGNITVQRYIDAGATNWRFLASPTQNGDIEQWDDNIITTGFIGSDYPNFNFTSIWKYDETVAGEFNNGYMPIASSAELLSAGKGFMVWSGTGGSATQPFTIDVNGPANIGNISLPVSHTNSGDSANDGWNLVGNPYASEIDWDSPAWIKTNINNAIYVWDPDASQYTSYINGVGINGGSQYIASGQAFWVQANGASPVLTATENIKTNSGQGFLAPTEAPKNDPLLKLEIRQENLHDELLVRFTETATLGFDQGFDAGKITSAVNTVPKFYSVIDSTQYSINSLPKTPSIHEIPIHAEVGINGTYQVSVTELSSFEHIGCVMLEDLLTGNVYNLKNSASFNASFSMNDPQPRFMLTIYPEVKAFTEAVSCFGKNDGEAKIEHLGNNVFQAIVVNHPNGITDSISGFSGTVELSELAAGKYYVSMHSNGSCPVVRDTFHVSTPDEINPAFTFTLNEMTHAASFENQSSGAVSYVWEFGDGHQSDENSPTHFYSSDGPFLLTLKASNSFGCETEAYQVIEFLGLIEEQTTSIEPLESMGVEIINSGKQLEINTFESGEIIEKVYLLDLQGRIVYEGSFDQTSVIIDLSALSSAIYSVEVRCASQSYQQLISVY